MQIRLSLPRQRDARRPKRLGRRRDRLAPGLFDDTAANDHFAIQKEIVAGEWRADPQLPDGAGNVVAKVLGLDVSNPAEKKRIKTRLKAWHAVEKKNLPARNVRRVAQ